MSRLPHRPPLSDTQIPSHTNPKAISSSTISRGNGYFQALQTSAPKGPFSHIKIGRSWCCSTRRLTCSEADDSCSRRRAARGRRPLAWAWRAMVAHCTPGWARSFPVSASCSSSSEMSPLASTLAHAQWDRICSTHAAGQHELKIALKGNIKRDTRPKQPGQLGYQGKSRGPACYQGHQAPP